MIEIQNISKSFNTIPALCKINLITQQGKTTVLIGPSGCGKSTLIRLIIGLIQPDGGKIIIEGQILQNENLRDMRRKIGYVIQEGGLFPHLSARANVSLMAKYLGWKRTQISERIAYLAKLTKFPLEALDRFPIQLSGGQRQRVSLMRALMLDPEILLLDEPLGALDPLIRYDLQSDLKLIFQTLKKTVLMVTHDLAEASFFADHLILMKEGEIIQQGVVRDLFEKPASDFVSHFVKAQRQTFDLIGGNSE